MKKLLTVSALALGAGLIFIATNSALAYRGDVNVKSPNYTPERHEAMTKAFEQNDYTAWKAQMQGRGRVTQVVTEQNFARFSEMHKLQLEGKTTEANKIRTELGLGQGNGSGRGAGCGMGRNLNK
jgi:hypothetical protein